MRTSRKLSLSEQISSSRQQIAELEAERTVSAQALKIPANTPPEKIVEAAQQLAGIEFQRQQQVIGLDLQLSVLRAKLPELESQLQAELQRELECRVEQSRSALEGKSRELAELVKRVNEVVEEAKAIAARGTADWKATTSSLSPYLRQMPDYRLSLPKISFSGDGFILTNKS